MTMISNQNQIDIATSTAQTENNAEALCLRGDAYLLDADTSLAIQSYEQALACVNATPQTSHDAYVGLSLVHTFLYNADDLYTDAQCYAEHALQQKSSAKALSLLGTIAILQTELTYCTEEKRNELSLLALNYAERALLLDSSNPDALTIYLHIYSQDVNHSSKVHEYAQRLEDILLQTATCNVYSLAYREMALYFLVQKQFTKLNQLLEHIADAEFPFVARVLSADDASIDPFEQAFAESEGYVKAYLGCEIVNYHSLSRHLDKTIEWGKMYINQIDSQSHEAHHEIGKAYMFKKDLQEALKWVKKADEIAQQTSRGALFLLAIIYSKLEDFDKVEECKTRLITLNSEYDSVESIQNFINATLRNHAENQ